MHRGRILLTVGVALAVVGLTAYIAGYLPVTSKPATYMFALQGPSSINQWECAKFALVAGPELAGSTAAMSTSPFGATAPASGYATEFYSELQCQLAVKSIFLDKGSYPASPSGQSAQFEFYLRPRAAPFSEAIIANVAVGSPIGSVSATHKISVTEPKAVPACRFPLGYGSASNIDTYCDTHCNQGPPPANDLPVKKDVDGKVYARIPYTGRPGSTGEFLMCCPSGFLDVDVKQNRCLKK